MFLKKKWYVMFIAMTTVLLLAACGMIESTEKEEENKDQNEPKTPEVEMTSSVEEVYNNHCVSCHGEDLKEDIGPDISKAGSKYTKDEIKDIALNGIGDMPANIVQDEKDAELIAEYLSELK
ncbi:MAG TPA: cytochrome c [Virgibacillus sp.]|nr:cytochrome c [Virgibacillus sp.]HLR66009.1 cytochrome c [Virgibacillus sp.]